MRRSRGSLDGLVLVIGVIGGSCGSALAQGALKPISVAPKVVNAARQLQLAVSINGEDRNLVEPFVYDPTTARLTIKRGDLIEAGVRAPPGAEDEALDLATLGVAYQFDDQAQTIGFTLTDAQRLPRVYNAVKASARPRPRADLGAIVNYSIFGGSIRDMNTGRFQFQGANAQLDARAFSDYGVLQQTGVIGTTLVNAGGGNDYLRLDTTYAFSSADTSISYRAGDLVSGGLAWSRPIHMGGAQVARDFTLRSDIVTQPLPIISGTAAAPSTVDILVNGSRTFSQSVGVGPFSITNLPINYAGGNAQVVIRDATGRVTQTSLALFNPAHMLAEGLSDFSLEGGLARRNYGVLSNDYLASPIGSGTFRYGVTQWLTVETHAEGGDGLVNLGAGAIVGLGGWGTTNLAIAASRSRAGRGAQAYADWQAQWGRFTFSLGTQRALANYDDLASVTANYTFNPVLPVSSQFGILPATGVNAYVSPRPPRATDRVAVSLPVFDDKSSISIGAVNLVQQNNTTSRLITASYSRTLPWRDASFYATAYADLGTVKSLGVFAGLTVPLWNGAYSSVGASYDRGGGAALTAEISKAQQATDDTYGWRLKSGLGQSTFGEVDASYRSSVGQVAASVAQTKSSTSATAQYDGSVALLGGVFLANKADSSFAVVNAGAPGVTVTQDSRAIGKTSTSGKYLVPNLREWDVNNIGIDPTGLPLTFDSANTNEVVAPRGKSGVYIDFGGRSNVSAAIVVFEDAGGKPIQLGSKGRLAGRDEPFLVGRDGRAYVRDLAAANTASIDLGDHECHASFAFEPVPGKQAIIRGVKCE